MEAVESVGGDTVLEIEVTPNRPDCLSILGLAREIGAITGRRLKTPRSKILRQPLLKKLIHIENKKDCSRYIGTLIRDVHINDAPQEMKKRLASLGINAINNAVDITNFVLMETGQPLHAFDYDKLAGGKIMVRRAKAGESIVTLDGIERKLDPFHFSDRGRPKACGHCRHHGRQGHPDNRETLKIFCWKAPISIWGLSDGLAAPWGFAVILLTVLNAM